MSLHKSSSPTPTQKPGTKSAQSHSHKKPKLKIVKTSKRFKTTPKKSLAPFSHPSKSVSLGQTKVPHSSPHLCSPFLNPKRSFLKLPNPLAKLKNLVKDQFQSETSQLGTCVGSDPEGNKFFEYREPWMSPEALPRRRVEFATSDLTTTVHELWDAWLRHSRQHPPSVEEFSRYDQKRARYLENVKRAEANDQQLRQQERLQKKFKGFTQTAPKQDPSTAQSSVADILKRMEERLALQRDEQSQLKLKQLKQQLSEQTTKSDETASAQYNAGVEAINSSLGMAHSDEPLIEKKNTVLFVPSPHNNV
jgi:NADH:ubiquinone oxidoreductase subunit